MKHTRLLILLAVFTVVLALQVLPLYAIDWQPIYEGVEYATSEKTSPRLMKAFAVRVDLWNPNVSLYASHSNGAASREVNVETGSKFITDHGCRVAVNASYCSLTSPTADIWGLGICDGTVVSSGTPPYPQYNAQMRFTADKVCTILNSTATPTGIHTAVTGNAYHLVDGVAMGANDVADPRTSFGLSQDGRYLIMVCVDGRQPGWSDGATIYDMSNWMLDFGAWNAINMDGGGSTCMTRQDIGVVNRPSGGSVRPVGVHLGVRTTPLLNPPYEFPYDTQGWFAGNSASYVEWAGPEHGWPGVMYFDQTGDDCFVFGPTCNFAGFQYPQVVQVSLYEQGGNTASHNMQAFWKTSAENYFDGAKASPVVNYTCQNGWTAVNLDVNNAKWWSQNVNQLRLDFDNTNTATRHIVNHVVVQNQLWWTFDSSTMGWVAGNSLTAPYYEGCCGWPGVLVTDQTGTDAYMWGPEISGEGFPYNYLGGVNDRIHVRLYPYGGNTANHNMQVFWITDSDGVWNEAKSTYVNYTGINQWVDVYLPVGQNPSWGQWGRIKQLRLDFDHGTNPGTRWIVDYIRTEY